MPIRREKMQELAQLVHAQLPDHCGFIVLVAPFGGPAQTGPASQDEDQRRAMYASNCQREDAVKILKTMLFRWGLNEEWMKDVQ